MFRIMVDATLLNTQLKGRFVSVRTHTTMVNILHFLPTLEQAFFAAFMTADDPGLAGVD